MIYVALCTIWYSSLGTIAGPHIFVCELRTCCEQPEANGFGRLFSAAASLIDSMIMEKTTFGFKS
jgi:hypothetical protein